MLLLVVVYLDLLHCNLLIDSTVITLSTDKQRLYRIHCRVFLLHLKGIKWIDRLFQLLGITCFLLLRRRTWIPSCKAIIITIIVLIRTLKHPILWSKVVEIITLRVLILILLQILQVILPISITTGKILIITTIWMKTHQILV